MANGDSAIEMLDVTGSPVRGPAREEEAEPLEEDVFLPATPVSKFPRLSARAHSTPRPKGSLTDSDAHLRVAGATAAPAATAEDSDGDFCERAGPKNPGGAGLIPPRPKQFAFCLALFALAVLMGFLAGYLVREKVFEREAILVADGDGTEDGTTPSAQTAALHHQHAVSNISASRIADYSSLFSQHPCTAGTPCSQTMSGMVVDRLKAAGFTDVSVRMYDVLTSLPDLSRASTLKTVDKEGAVIHSAVLYGGQADDGSGEGGADGRRRRQTAGTQTNATESPSTVMYMPYSGSGQAKGEMVYVHYASEGDFLMLADDNIEVQGKIGIARHGTMMVVDQVRNVQEQGMMGLILYTDPADMDAMATMGMERLVGMTGMMGDPMTPGCSAMGRVAGMTSAEVGMFSIPVQPVSTELAASLLGNMTGRMAPDDWQGELGIDYYMGLRNSKKSTWTVELDIGNMQKEQPIHNVLATLTGTQMPDEYIMLGSHFPMMAVAPGAGAAGDHGSAAAMMEAATVLGQMVGAGWQPRRSVLLGMWGGAEYGHAGSARWAGEHRRSLAQRAVAYLDLDAAVGSGGQTVAAKSSPLLTGVITEAASSLEIEHSVVMGMLTGTGDHVAFSHMLGIPSAQLYAPHDMSEGDPMASASMTKLATKMVMMLADGDMIPFQPMAMGAVLTGYLDQMAGTLTLSNATMGDLKMAAGDFMAVATEMQSMMADGPAMQSSVTMTMVNHRLMYMERAFVNTDASGSMTNILYGMTEMETFPLVTEYATVAMSNDTMATMMQQVTFMQCAIQSATLSLKMDLL